MQPLRPCPRGPGAGQQCGGGSQGQAVRVQRLPCGQVLRAGVPVGALEGRAQGRVQGPGSDGEAVAGYGAIYSTPPAGYGAIVRTPLLAGGEGPHSLLGSSGDACCDSHANGSWDVPPHLWVGVATVRVAQSGSLLLLHPVPVMHSLSLGLGPASKACSNYLVPCESPKEEHVLGPHTYWLWWRLSSV